MLVSQTLRNMWRMLDTCLLNRGVVKTQHFHILSAHFTFFPQPSWRQQQCGCERLRNGCGKSGLILPNLGASERNRCTKDVERGVHEKATFLQVPLVVCIVPRGKGAERVQKECGKYAGRMWKGWGTSVMGGEWVGELMRKGCGTGKE